MATPQRIYVVRNVAAEVDAEQIPPRPLARLVRAPNAAQATRHVAADTLVVEVASQDDLVELVAAGVAVEQSGDAALAETSAKDVA